MSSLCVDIDNNKMLLACVLGIWTFSLWKCPNNRRMSEELYGSFKEYIVKEKVNCISFAELIFKHNFEKIDLLK